MLTFPIQSPPIANRDEILHSLALGDGVQKIRERTKNIKLIETDSKYVISTTELLNAIPDLSFLLQDKGVYVKIKQSALALDLLQDDFLYEQEQQINTINFIADSLLCGLKSMFAKEGVRHVIQKYDGFFLSLLLPYLNQIKPFSAIEELVITLKSPSLYVIVLRILSSSLVEYLDSHPQWPEKEIEIETVGRWVELMKSLLKNLRKDTRESQWDPINLLLDRLGSSLSKCILSFSESSKLDEVLNIFIPVIVDILQILCPDNQEHNINISIQSIAPKLTESLQQFTAQSISLLNIVRNRQKSTLSALRIFQLLRVLSKSNDFQQSFSKINIMMEALRWIKLRTTSHILHFEIKELLRSMVDCAFYKEILKSSDFSNKLSKLISRSYSLQTKNQLKTTEHVVYCSEMARIYNTAYPNTIRLSDDGYLLSEPQSPVLKVQKTKPTQTPESPPWSQVYNNTSTSPFSPPIETDPELKKPDTFFAANFKWTDSLQETPILQTVSN
eukprot:TRINITY_DN1370_c0_g2_i3.p1 TRINITY_DN1370_c0_g2~~TRINITY_DN1370_c0_g2_i3.p1  ORF type:complete len:502 (+),score=75.73 TRINITY_DN1370_c0_g2_i3:636-2141(+)